MKQTQIQQQLFNELHQSQLEDARAFIKPKYRSMFNGVIDKYSDSAHFIYELLQNADDANAVHVEMILQRERFVFIHDGNVRFTVSDPKTEEEDRQNGKLGHINSITSIGFSTKNIAEASLHNKIGKFGVGFKAIFQYTTTPYIYDDPFCFKIEHFIVPTEIENRDFYIKRKTVFVVPFDRKDITPKKSYNEIEQKIKSLEYPQLFLHNVKSIIWRTDTESGSIEKKTIKFHPDMYSIHPVYYSLKNSNGKSVKVLLMTRQIEIEKNGKHEIAIGYFIDSRGKIDTGIRPMIHCFFPTSESIDTCYVIHAPFALVDNREQIKKDNDINSFIFKEIGKLSADSLLVLRDIGISSERYLLNDNILDLLHFNLRNLYSGISFYYQRNLSEDFRSSLCHVYDNERVFLSKSGKYICKSQGRWCTNELQKLLTSKQLNELLVKSNKYNDGLYDFILCGITAKRAEILDEYSINRFTDSDFASGITTEFMEHQSLEWLNLFYEYIVTKRLVEVYAINKGVTHEAVMRYVPVVKTEAGSFVAPYIGKDVNVFFSLDGNMSAEQVISSSLYQSSLHFQTLLKKLDIKAPSEVDLIRFKIDSLNSMSRIEENNFLALIMQTYKRLSLVDRDELLRIISDNYSFVCNMLNDKKKHAYYRKLAADICSNDEDLRTYYTLSKLEDKFFVDMNFYSFVCKQISADEISDFFSAVIVSKRPSFVHVELPLSRKENEVKSNYRIGSKNVGIIHGLHNVLISMSNKIRFSSLSKYIWNLLCYYTENERDFLSNDYSEYFYYKTHSYTWPYCSMKIYLQKYKWICIDGVMKSLTDNVYSEDLLNNGYQYNALLFEKLGIESSPKVKERESISQMSEETNAIFKLGEYAKKIGIRNLEEMQNLLQAGIEVKRKELEKKKLLEKRQKEHQDVMGQFPERKKESALTEGDFKSPNNESAKSSVRRTKNLDTMNLDEVLSGFEEKINIQKQEFEEVLALRDLANNSPKYSYTWLKSLMELEVRAQGKSDVNGKKAIYISFDEILKNTKVDNVIVLRGASRTIPTIVEDIDEIPITFYYKDGQKTTIEFDVASVKDDCLILKGSSKQLVSIKKVKEESFDIFKATLEVERPVELIKYWENLILGLGFDDSASLKDGLRTDLKFIFGPPGTGKTTKLASYIIDLMRTSKRKCKVLVLAPTNKACDVLTEKILDCHLEDDTWLWRFVSTMSQRVEDEEVVYNRNSDISSQDRVCVVSTIARYAFDGFDTGALNQLEWDYVIIDEASMIPLYQIIPPLYNTGCKHILIAGDPFQIEPIVQIEEWKSENIYSLINLNNFVSPVTEPIQFEVETLMTQYRSIPTIGEIYSQYMYGGKLNHYKKETEHRVLNLGLAESPLNIVNYPVTKETIFDAKRLGYSSIHLYSVIFTVEFIKYLAKHIYESHPKDMVKIGVLSPYSAEVQAIEKMYNQNTAQYENIEIITGTSHGFQGDECDIVIAVMNPPSSGMKRAADLTFINKSNILNVAISRAKDYLFVLIPSKDYECFDSLYEVKKLGRIMSSQKCKFYSSDDLEKVMFGKMHYIEDNTFVTTHQTTNVYSDPFAKYEIRIDDTAMDVQINEI